jgi:hypothetical protein
MISRKSSPDLILCWRGSKGYLGRKLFATDTAAGSQNRATCAGLHAGAKTMGLGTTTVVRLKGTL